MVAGSAANANEAPGLAKAAAAMSAADAAKVFLLLFAHDGNLEREIASARSFSSCL